MIIQTYMCPKCGAELVSEKSEKETVRPGCFSCGRKMDIVKELDLSKKKPMSRAKIKEMVGEAEKDPIKHRKKKRAAKKQLKTKR